MQSKLNVLFYGLGPIGQETARLALSRPSLQIVGAVDCNPKLAGQDLGDLLKLDQSIGCTIEATPAPLLNAHQAKAVVHCTTSRFTEAYEQIREIVNAGLHCVTSCEEALFPYHRHRDLAKQLDALCKEKSVCVVGTGVNPGMVMDTLPVLLTTVCQRVKSIYVSRIVDVSTRRSALQKKVGVGLTEAEYAKLNSEQKLGHVGLVESFLFIADALGWELYDVKEIISPVLFERMVLGSKHIVEGQKNGNVVLTLDLQMYVNAPQPRDEIVIEGEPPMRMIIEGGTAGDTATPAVLLNVLPRLMEASPGLHTMRTLGLCHLAR